MWATFTQKPPNHHMVELKCNLQLAVCSRHAGLDGIVFPAFRATFCTLAEPQKNQARPTSYVSDFYEKTTKPPPGRTQVQFTISCV